MNLQWHTIITQSPQFASGFTLGVVWSMGLNQCIMTCIHHYCIIQNSFIALMYVSSVFKYSLHSLDPLLVCSFWGNVWELIDDLDLSSCPKAVAVLFEVRSAYAQLRDGCRTSYTSSCDPHLSPPTLQPLPLFISERAGCFEYKSKTRRFVTELWYILALKIQ